MNVQPAGNPIRTSGPSTLDIQRAKIAKELVPGQLKSAVITALTKKGMTSIEAQNVLEKMINIPNSPYSRVLNEAISKFKSSSNPGQHERMLNNSAKGLVDAWDPKSGSFIKNASEILGRTGGNSLQRASSTKTFKQAPLPKQGTIESFVKQGIKWTRPLAEGTLKALQEAQKTKNLKIKTAATIAGAVIAGVLSAEAGRAAVNADSAEEK